MPIQPSGERAVRSGYDDNLAAGCTKCSWFDGGKRAVRLAESGKLVCFGCGGSVGVFYIPLRPCGVEAGVSADLHEGVAGTEAGERAKLRPGRHVEADGPTVLGKREYNRRYKARRRALEDREP